MSCKDKNCGKNCGCKDSALSIGPSFSNDPTICPPDSEPCTEVFDMACICYQGDDIVQLDIARGDRLDEILQKLILATTDIGCATFDDATTCQSPINLLVSNITTTAISLSWEAVLSAVTYSVEYKESTSLVWLINPSITAPVVVDLIVGLAPDTIHDIRVNAICATGTCYSLTIRIKTAALPA